jgi:hypothetical protein
MSTSMDALLEGVNAEFGETKGQARAALPALRPRPEIRTLDCLALTRPP